MGSMTKQTGDKTCSQKASPPLEELITQEPTSCPRGTGQAVKGKLSNSSQSAYTHVAFGSSISPTPSRIPIDVETIDKAMRMPMDFRCFLLKMRMQFTFTILASGFQLLN
jgi:hypothetical protein